jgi:hypothetical protein
MVATTGRKLGRTLEAFDRQTDLSCLVLIPCFSDTTIMNLQFSFKLNKIPQIKQIVIR